MLRLGKGSGETKGCGKAEEWMGAALFSLPLFDATTLDKTTNDRRHEMPAKMWEEKRMTKSQKLALFSSST
jgi:hypothetical protein